MKAKDQTKVPAFRPTAAESQGCQSAAADNGRGAIHRLEDARRYLNSVRGGASRGILGEHGNRVQLVIRQTCRRRVKKAEWARASSAGSAGYCQCAGSGSAGFTGQHGRQRGVVHRDHVPSGSRLQSAGGKRVARSANSTSATVKQAQSGRIRKARLRDRWQPAGRHARTASKPSEFIRATTRSQ